MKVYSVLFVIFVSFVVFAYSGLFDHELLGGTQLNGSGCVCHTTEIDTSVMVWIEGPDTLISGETALFKMYLAKGPAEAGGYNVAGRYGTMSLVDSFSVWDYRSPNELTQAFPLVFPTPMDTIYWAFAYTAPDSVLTDTLYSCGLSIVYDSIPDARDRWNFGPKFPVTIIQSPVPVELVSFSAQIENNTVNLKWITSSELNNYGFDLERSIIKVNRKEIWESVGFVKGNGTTTNSNTYFFKDDISNITDKSQFIRYRLKQTDNDGSFKYSNEVKVEVEQLTDFSLLQNFPNPFNPVTKISYSIPANIYKGKGTKESFLVTLGVYDLLGQEITTLVNEEKPVGVYEVIFNAGNLSSGIYFYQLKIQSANSKVVDYIQTKKMVLMR
ncbi:MAG: choice-of-anchor V domain-containing protein [Ignavibacterium sp.]|jgi:hypothetical protein|nr:choice-of-anchor V domain-containing protein [Ignavibacterium sp.]